MDHQISDAVIKMVFQLNLKLKFVVSNEVFKEEIKSEVALEDEFKKGIFQY